MSVVEDQSMMIVYMSAARSYDPLHYRHRLLLSLKMQLDDETMSQHIIIIHRRSYHLPPTLMMNTLYY